METIVENCNECGSGDRKYRELYDGKSYMVTVNSKGLYVAVCEEINDECCRNRFFDQSSDNIGFWMDLFRDGQLIGNLDSAGVLQ